MNANPVCKKCGVVIYTNEVIEIEGDVYCTADICTNSTPVNTRDSMSWSDLKNKHDRYE